MQLGLRLDFLVFEPRAGVCCYVWVVSRFQTLTTHKAVSGRGMALCAPWWGAGVMMLERVTVEWVFLAGWWCCFSEA